MNRKDAFISQLLAIALLTGCVAPIGAVPSETEASKTEPVLPTPSDLPPTPEPSPVPTPLRPGRGGIGDPSVFETTESKEQIEALDSCVEYWSQTDPPIALPEEPGSETSSLYYKPIKDSGVGAGEKDAVVVLESKPGDPNWEGKVGIQPFPLWSERRGCPAVEPGQPVAEGMDPFLLSTIVREGSEPANVGIPIGSTLEFKNGNFVMVDQDGRIVGMVDSTGHWKNLSSLPESRDEFDDKCIQISKPGTPGYIEEIMEFAEGIGETIISNLSYDEVVSLHQQGAVGVGNGEILIHNVPINDAICFQYNYASRNVAMVGIPFEMFNNRFWNLAAIDTDGEDLPNFPYVYRSEEAVLSALPKLGKGEFLMTIRTEPYVPDIGVNTPFMIDFFSTIESRKGSGLFDCDRVEGNSCDKLIEHPGVISQIQFPE